MPSGKYCCCILTSMHEKNKFKLNKQYSTSETRNSTVYWYLALWISDFRFASVLFLDLSSESEFFKLRIFFIYLS